MILGAAAAAPEAPAIAWALLALTAAVGFIVCLALLQIWKRTIGALFEAAAGISVFHVHPLRFLRKASDQVASWLSQAALAQEHAVVYAFHKFIGIQMWIGQSIAGLAIDTYNFVRGREKHTTNVVVRPLDAKTRQQIATLRAQEAILDQRLDRLEHARKGGKVITGNPPNLVLSRGIDRLKKQIAAINLRLRQLSRGKAGVRARPAAKVGAPSRKWTDVLTKSAAAAAVAFALGRLGLGCLLGRNGKTAVKSLCGMNPNVLDSLIFDAALLTVAMDIRGFAEEMQAVVGEGADLIHRWAS